MACYKKEPSDNVEQAIARVNHGSELWVTTSHFAGSSVGVYHTGLTLLKLPVKAALVTGAPLARSKELWDVALFCALSQHGSAFATLRALETSRLLRVRLRFTTESFGIGIPGRCV